MSESFEVARRARQPWRWAVIAAAVLLLAAAFAFVGGWLSPQRLTPHRIVDALQENGGLHPGYRRNHAKGVCVGGYFESNGTAAVYSTATVFAAGRTPVVGRFAIPGGNPYAPDSGTQVRSLALRFSLANGQQWRTAMNNMPVFVVATPEAFYQMLQAGRPDPATGKPDGARMGAFFAAHPETAAFLTWAKAVKPSASFATDSYYSLDAFYLVDASGQRHAVRWRVVPEARDDGSNVPDASDNDYLAQDLQRRLAAGPQRWHLLLTLAAPGDPTNDATKAWPADRPTVDAGTLVIDSEQAQDGGPCRDVNYDPTILPTGMRISDDPLLPARSAAYADSYLRRTSEEGHLPGAASAGARRSERK
ncbi:catalase family peroxidase [Dyella soli]|uniref:Catalase-related peroxidase n=1 Tax=Dyella soli TaxID=522319 RepID=A0A4R0YW30_9GAMM|nr:catalase family peroxidase [Dyella soli]TCI11193.1 catalase family peroxidase [Dyella soli]